MLVLDSFQEIPRDQILDAALDHDRFRAEPASKLADDLGDEVRMGQLPALPVKLLVRIPTTKCC